MEVYDFLIEDGHAARNPELARRRKEEDHEVRRGPFEEAFLDKGRMTDLLADVPVWAILDDEIGIVGAATAGARAKRESEKGSMREAGA